jgi:hypothetical protein
MSIKILKLVSGDDVITEIGKGEGVVMENPARLMMMPGEDGNIGMALIPWCPYSDKKDFTIAPIHVLTEIEEKDIPEGMVNEYRKQFGSGLDIPTGPSLIV